MGAAIAARGWDLVWGGGVISMMGAVSRGARENGAKTFGVIPEKLLSVEFIDEQATQNYVVSDMRTRKAKLEELADGFVILPGGIGTLEEFFEIWVGRYLKFHNKPIAVCDPFGTFDPLQTALQHLVDVKLMKSGQQELVIWGTGVTQALDGLSLDGAE